MSKQHSTSYKTWLFLTTISLVWVQNTVSIENDVEEKDVTEVLPNVDLSSIEKEDDLIDELFSCDAQSCDSQLKKKQIGKENSNNVQENNLKKSLPSTDENDANQFGTDETSQVNKHGKAMQTEVRSQLESLRQIASLGVVKVLKKLDDILERREKLPESASSPSSASASIFSSTSPPTSSSPESASSSSSDSASVSSSRSPTLKDAEERLKLASAAKLRTELESLVDDALDLVGDKLRRHLKTASGDAASGAAAASGADSAASSAEEMKRLLKSLEEKNDKRRLRRDDVVKTP